MFHRIGQAAYRNNLDNTLKLDKIFGHPHRRYKTVHIAGTNGKGSVSHVLAAVLQSAGYKTGLYTSPHLKDFRERIKINGEMISEDEVIQWVEDYPVKNNLWELEPSFFELTATMAFDFFAKKEVDIAIIEVGLGGRLDSTNIITPEVSVITNIGLDHTNLLGETLEIIAAEKAGIIKMNIPTVIGTTQKE
ncbi:MAG TPA: Mur ligase family protein, partial [Draconibacterium sp.]|nr:Mur ligase family protein [Draconibacterium sp.]